MFRQFPKNQNSIIIWILEGIPDSQVLLSTYWCTTSSTRPRKKAFNEDLESHVEYNLIIGHRMCVYTSDDLRLASKLKATSIGAQ